ncbi:ankyrin repeat protein [Podospora australis]|uniref:Ankyrin repeat protein n=1 Tax=Podospora australis TaxID=1536484 RepID=A0AAN7AGJ3_9PEZI|nr:ankyrin repeat protein [Podospora australis]
MAVPRIEDLPVPPKDLPRYIADHPEMPMVDIIKPYRQYEADLRAAFAQDRTNPALEDPHLNVLPLFTEDTELITTRARDLDNETEEEKSRYIMPLPDHKRRPHGSPAVVGSIKEFQKNFAIFSESSLADLNWNNVVAAGSSVVNCLVPVPAEFNTSKRKLREYYHEKFCPASDVDLFLYGLTHDEAIEKMKEIERAIRDSILTEVTVVRTKYAITIASQYPTRHVQIVLRVYKSVGEILTGFDIDAAGGAYDGKQVYVAPRALASYITQINHIDLTRRSPSYENRLSKYSHRNFEVYWPDLDRGRVDPTIFERSFQRTLGLARLLVLERLPTSSARETYMNKRRQERGRPAFQNTSYFRRLGGNIKDYHEDEVADWVDEGDVSNYHTFTVPYGAKFNAKKIEKLCYTRDLLLNAEWNQPKEREVYLHRHPAFFGRVQDVIEDCCGSCPTPVTPEEKEAAEKEGEIYISGKVSFLIDNPGRQQIGSFNPLTDDDWTDMAYIGNTARLCQSIVDGDLEDVQNWLAQEGADPNKRDYTGRSPLHLAVMSSTPEVVKCLVGSGARITARLADGRTALHLAAEGGKVEMIKILMEKSTANEEEYEEQQSRLKAAKFGSNIDGVASAKKTDDEEGVKDQGGHGEEDGSDSDLEVIDGEETEADVASIATGSFVKVKKVDEEVGKDIVPEESSDEPDYYKIDALSWDVPCSPLHYAIAGGHEEAVSVLCEFGADAILPVKFLNSDKEPTNAILTLALALTLPLDKAKSMAKLLLKLGASSSQADFRGCTAFHRYVAHGETELIDELWELDKTGVKAALNHLILGTTYWDNRAVAPLHMAIGNGDSILVMKLLEAGATPEIDFDSWLRATKFSARLEQRLQSYDQNKALYHRSVDQPLMVALRTSPDPEMVLHLLRAGADPNTMTGISYQLLTDQWQRSYNKGETALDVVREHIKNLREYSGEKFSAVKPELREGMDEYLASLDKNSYLYWLAVEDVEYKKKLHKKAVKDYEKQLKKFEETQGAPEKKQAIEEALAGMEQVEALLLEQGGKTFKELHPDIETTARQNNQYGYGHNATVEPKTPYTYKILFHNTTDVTDKRQKAYEKLFEAAWSGDLQTIKTLTTTSWDEDQSESPLKIAVRDDQHSNPVSLAFLRGHIDVARAILEIAEAQYVPAEEESKRFHMETGNNDEEEYHSEYDSEEDRSSVAEDDSEPRIVSRNADNKFTIDNIGQISMQVKSRTRPLELLLWECKTFKVEADGKVVDQHRQGLLRFVMAQDDNHGLKTLLDWGEYFASRKLPGDVDEDATGLFTFPDHEFQWAVEKGKTQMLAEIIQRTGAGIPLEHFVKKSGVKLQEKPKHYQGLTVYGKKRKDWANAGRNLVVKTTGMKTSPLLLAVVAVNIESVEWFLGDAPYRHYTEFGQSKAALADPKLKHLSKTPGGFDRAVSRWLGGQNETILHLAVMADSKPEAIKLINYILQTHPFTLETKTSDGNTPLMTATWFGRTEYVKILIDAGADQSVRNKSGNNILHEALSGMPTANQLKPFLQLLDKDFLPHLFISRNNLHADGLTPLHQFITDTAVDDMNNRMYRRTSYKTDDEYLDVIKLLVKYSGGADLEMLNSAGDSILHTAVVRNDSVLTNSLLELCPKLLFRENAVGRTPAEVARDRVTAAKFKAPRVLGVPSDQQKSISELPKKAPDQFLEKNKKSTTREWADHGVDSTILKVWKVCLKHMEKHPDSKRRLVSLNEANDVAKRLGEQYSSSRYFSVQARGEDDDDHEQPEEEEKDEEERVSDFTLQSKNQRAGRKWICEKCSKRPIQCKCGREKKEGEEEEDSEPEQFGGGGLFGGGLFGTRYGLGQYGNTFGQY